jgi:N-methylhydantoinase A/oxoprolinase/acetone carboxylase beta subunit
VALYLGRQNIMTIHTHRIAIDVGGRFTDLVASNRDGSARILRRLSTPDDYTRAIVYEMRLARNGAE